MKAISFKTLFVWGDILYPLIDGRFLILENTLITGIVYAIAADLVWGLAFVIPMLLGAYSAIEIAFGRYLTYGIISLLIFLCTRKARLNRTIWQRALLFAFCGNVGYYVFLVFSIQLTGATITTLVIGLLPITVSLYGNLLNREYAFMKILPSLFVILIGIFTINYSSITSNEHGWNPYGVVSSLAALASWTWYGVANARFLKENPQISSTDWSSITGVATLCLLPFFMLVSVLFVPESISVTKLLYSHSSWGFWIGSTVLGVVVSWIGTVFWNRASHLLPVSLAGQLTVGETICGLGYVFFADLRLPLVWEWIGIIMIVSGVLFGIRTINRLKEVNMDANIRNQPT